jgi:hypothetical protein
VRFSGYPRDVDPGPSLFTLREEHREKVISIIKSLGDCFAVKHCRGGELSVVNVRKIKKPAYCVAGCGFDFYFFVRSLQTRLHLLEGKDVNVVGNNTTNCHTIHRF